jgi:hypothetical protein
MTFFSCLLAILLALAPACAAKDASRLKELQRRLLDGQPLRLAALGGSSTAGHQLPRDSPLLYYNRLVGWINESHPHVETLVVNSGTPATGPTYMEKCPCECAQRVGPMHRRRDLIPCACSPRLHTAALAVWPRPWRDHRFHILVQYHRLESIATLPQLCKFRCLTSQLPTDPNFVLVAFDKNYVALRTTLRLA